jgi:hypothetical protein
MDQQNNVIGSSGTQEQAHRHEVPGQENGRQEQQSGGQGYGGQQIDQQDTAGGSLGDTAADRAGDDTSEEILRSDQGLAEEWDNGSEGSNGSESNEPGFGSNGE